MFQHNFIYKNGQQARSLFANSWSRELCFSVFFLFYQGYILFYSSVTQHFFFIQCCLILFYLAIAVLIGSTIYLSNHKASRGYSSFPSFFYLYHNPNFPSHHQLVSTIDTWAVMPVLISYCCITKHPKTQWLKNNYYYFS